MYAGEQVRLLLGLGQFPVGARLPGRLPGLGMGACLRGWLNSRDVFGKGAIAASPGDFCRKFETHYFLRPKYEGAL